MTHDNDDQCDYGRTPPDDPASLACDYSGLYQTHYCHNSDTWRPETQRWLDESGTVAVLRAAWETLEDMDLVDGLGGSEYHHALAHLRHKLAHREAAS